MPNISPDKIIDEIEKRNVVPIPRWHFILKRAVFWVLALISVVTGAISMATAIYVFFDNDYIVDRAGIEKLFEQRPLVEVIVQSIPYVWLLALALFIIVAYYGFRHTRKGYRYPMVRVIGGSLLLSVLLCGILDAFDIGKQVHRYLIDNIRGYGSLVYTNDVLWAQQEKGLLGGKVVRSSPRGSVVVIRDYRHHYWTVDISSARAHPGTTIAVGKYLKITGLKTGPATFKAVTIRPWVKKIHHRHSKAPAQAPAKQSPASGKLASPFPVVQLSK
jgi:heme/copper-type cytochrome/quinol oxidase subunit 2